ncbi:hypothetical protein [Sphingomonas sp. 37zxx]|nr:hypothetical protein [Sphingomonas sp. 37zxx]
MNNLYGLLDAAIVVIPVMGFAIWQWMSVSREIERGKAAKPKPTQSE